MYSRNICVDKGKEFSGLKIRCTAGKEVHLFQKKAEWLCGLRTIALVGSLMKWALTTDSFSSQDKAGLAKSCNM